MSFPLASVSLSFEPLKCKQAKNSTRTSKCHRQRPPSLHKAEVEFEKLLVMVHLLNNTGFVVVVNEVKMIFDGSGQIS